MSAPLYVLAGQWRALADKLSDMDLPPEAIADTLEGSDEQMALEEKAQGYELVARNIEATLPAIDAEIKRLQALKKAITARSEALRARVLDTMQQLGIERVTCPLFELRVQNNPPALDVYDPDLVPQQYWRTEPVLDKAALKDAIKSGADVQGARLTRGVSLRVR